MNNIISSMCDYEDAKGTYVGYYAQYKNTVKSIAIGDKVVVMPNTWQENIIKIIFTDDTIALGVVIKGLSVGSKTLYHNKCENIGWKYGDNRGAYRLQSLPLNKG